MSGLDFETIVQIVMFVVAFYVMYLTFTKDVF
jgi:hypothetical protein